jgi:hypothetical protein
VGFQPTPAPLEARGGLEAHTTRAGEQVSRLTFERAGLQAEKYTARILRMISIADVSYALFITRREKG